MPEVSESDFQELVGLHKLYLDLLLKGATFAATAQAAIIAIGGGRLTEGTHVRFVATGVFIVALVAVALFAFAIPKLEGFDKTVISVAKQLDKAWRPHTHALVKIAWGGVILNAACVVSAVAAALWPDAFAVGG